MGEIRVKLSDEIHKKLNILCTIYRKTQDELIEMLIKRARFPGSVIEDFLIADEEEPKTLESGETKIGVDVEPFEAEEI